MALVDGFRCFFLIPGDRSQNETDLISCRNRENIVKKSLCPRFPSCDKDIFHHYQSQFGSMKGAPYVSVHRLIVFCARRKNSHYCQFTLICNKHLFINEITSQFSQVVETLLLQLRRSFLYISGRKSTGVDPISFPSSS